MHDPSTPSDIRQQIRDCAAHLANLLPGQAPIRDFVHHNSLHGFAHLSFPEAVAQAHRITGNRGYPTSERFRAYLAEGRITRADLAAVITETEDLEPDRILLERTPRPLCRGDIYLAALCHPIDPIGVAQLNWRIDEQGALERLQPDLDPPARARLLNAAGTSDETRAVADLWSACLSTLGLDSSLLHPEELTDLSPEDTERMLSGLTRATADPDPDETAPPPVERQIRMDAAQRLQALLDQVGPDITLRGLLLALTGEDLLEQIRPHLIRHLSNFLDEGFSAWANPNAHQGLYRAWRTTAESDLAPLFRGLQGWRPAMDALPDDALEAIVAELKHRELPRARWIPYLERLALELPGWSAMALWRHRHPDYPRGRSPVDLLDYLAVRLVLERVYAQRLCREQWQIEPNLDMLRWYFRRNPQELFVRHALHGEPLPEYLVARAERAAAATDLDPEDRGWRETAALVWTWRRSPGAEQPRGRTLYRHAWPLFRLAQHLGLAAQDLARLGPDGVDALFACLERLDADRSGFLWLRAFERGYRESVLTALAHNRGRARWRDRVDDARPAAQVVLCMDDREEGLRRHLEELNPALETLGAAAHFNVPHNWRGLDDQALTSLAPVIPTPVIPVHEVRECPKPGSEIAGASHRRRHDWLRTWGQRLLEHGRLGIFGPAAEATAGGPIFGLSLLGKLAAPRSFGALKHALRTAAEPPIQTHIAFLATREDPEPGAQTPRLGFTDTEQADRVETLLRAMGLTRGIAPLVAVIGHASRNQNNPHAPAYNCGACAGRFSGPNARLVCAMANRPRVRALLAERGIRIPDETWFVGAEHDTCTDAILWYDEQDLPPTLTRALSELHDQLDRAGRLHARERSRRFASAPPNMDPSRAFRHVAVRALDISQVRPELGHATNACAFIGRRAMSRGAFFDRRAFLISYDPTQDPDGRILEQHLLTNGAVGAGISLEYYFSAANDEGYGCGSKTLHNVAGLLGVMEGATSDLRTGLPRQMVEVHEPMRLLVVVEASTRTLSDIYARAPAVAQLAGGDWIQLAAMDPDTGAIHRFRSGTGWVPWTPPLTPPPTRPRSGDCYRGSSAPCPPVLIRAPDRTEDPDTDHA